MSPTIRGTPRSAGSSSCRIECVPSWRAAVAATAWVLLACAITLGGVALPLSLRTAIATVLAVCGFGTSYSVVWLRGSSAVRAMEWRPGTPPGTWWLEIGPARRRVAATLDRRSFRVGRAWLVLVFSTPAGTRRVLVDGGVHERRAFRRLCREFSRHSRGVRRPEPRAS
jgi:hypothetical protein